MSVTEVSQVLKDLKATSAWRHNDEQLQSVATALLGCLKDGLKGNRAVSDSVWSVVIAATRAYPIQLSPSVEKAQAVVNACPGADLAQTWALQAVADGALMILLQKLRSQPQIVTAYSRSALIRDAKAVEQLCSALQELKDLVQVTPYDLYLQQTAAETGTAAAPIHIQTEEDLHRPEQSIHNQHQQKPSDSNPLCCSSSSTAGETASIHQQNQQVQQPPEQQAAVKQTNAAGRLAGRKLPIFNRARGDKLDKDSSNSSSNSSACTSIAPAPHAQADNSIQQHDSTAPAAVRVQLLVQVGRHNTAGETSSASTDAEQPFVKLLLLPQDGIVSTAGHSSSSSTKLLGAGADAVKGLFQGLQQSATAGLQHGAAAGHELGGAVAAAGGAVVGAISQPFAAVRSFAARASSSKKASNSQDTTDAAGLPSRNAPADADAAESLGKRKSSFFRKRSSSAAPAETADDGTAAAPPSSSSTPTAAVIEPAANALSVDHDEQLLRVQLTVTTDVTQPVQLMVKPVDSNGSTMGAQHQGKQPQKQSSRSYSSQLPGWSATKTVLGKYSMRRGSNSHKDPGSSEITAAAQLAGSQGPAAGTAGTRATAAEPGEQAASDDILEGDMWSVMERLKHTGSSTKQSQPTSQEAANVPTAVSPSAVAAAAQHLGQQGQSLMQQLLEACDQVKAAAGVTKGCLGDESAAVVQLVGLIKDMLHHGLRSAPASLPASENDGITLQSRAHAAKDMLGGWLPSSKATTAFGVLQALQHGSKQHPRLMLGADGIANMKAAKSSTAAVKLDMWVRASLNEQLLHVRLSTLAANPLALAAWYHPQALLLQQQPMQQLLQQLSGLCQHKFALLVETSGNRDGPGDSAGAKRTSSVVSESRKFLGGLTSFGLGVLPGLSSGTSTAEASDTAAGNSASNSTENAGPVESATSSSSIPTFLWSALGSTDSSSSSGGTAGFFKRGRRVANIKEVRVPPPDSAAVLSSEPSCALSPVSTAGDAAYAEWWSPNSSWQDFTTAEGLTSGAADGSAAGGAGAWQSSGGGGLPGFSSYGGTAFAEAIGHAAAPSEQHVQQKRQEGNLQDAGSEHVGGVQSEAAVKLEEELAAAMNAPIAHVLSLERSCGARSSDSGAGETLRRCSSTGWEAAVARARGKPGDTVRLGAGLGVVGHHQKVASLYRRSRSPDASTETVGGGIAVAVASRSGRRKGHMHKRSSSLNDLPELEALFETFAPQQ